MFLYQKMLLMWVQKQLSNVNLPIFDALIGGKMTLIRHNQDNGVQTYPLQAIRITPKTTESYECFRKDLRPKVYNKNFGSCHNAEIPLDYINTKDKFLDFVYQVWGAGNYVMVLPYVNNYSRKRFKKSYNKMLCKVWIREFIDKDDNVANVEKRMYDDEYINRQKWFKG